jgi:protein-tyrosine phosphatase
MARQVLFLCTGNYYRSRFAEILFNHLAEQRRLAWRADSRGLARKFGPWNIGLMSPFTVQAIIARGIPCPEPLRAAMHCFEDDLKLADLVVALKEAEHRPLLAEHFAGWEDRVEYWHVHDLDGATPDVALGEIEVLVKKLIERVAR